eukprot:scaffold35485_cov76-Phaeocystis_antarctica.AAC.2
MQLSISSRPFDRNTPGYMDSTSNGPAVQRASQLQRLALVADIAASVLSSTSTARPRARRDTAVRVCAWRACHCLTRTPSRQLCTAPPSARAPPPPALLPRRRPAAPAKAMPRGSRRAMLRGLRRAMRPPAGPLSRAGASLGRATARPT